MKRTVATTSPLLQALSDQLLDLRSRVADDVARYADPAVGPSGGGFVIYYLTDDNGEPLKDVTALDRGITIQEIENTAGFSKLRQFCEQQSLKVRIDEHFYANDPQPTKVYRVVVDGWS